MTSGEQWLAVILVGGRKQNHTLVIFADERFESVRGSEAGVNQTRMGDNHAENFTLHLWGFGSLEEAFDETAQFSRLAWIPGSSDG